MILGGLRIGVTPLDMAHAYETFAEGGRRVYDPELGAPNEGPVGIAEIQCPQTPIRVCNRADIKSQPQYDRVLPAGVANAVHDLLAGVVQSGTGTHAAISGVDVVGKTGTTSNYGDAWFVGWTPEMTTAVWVGFPDKLVSMATMYNGQPVEGGTYPANIWHEFMVQALQILANEQAAAQAKAAQSGQTSTTSTSTTGTTGLGSGSGGSGSGAGTGTGTGTATGTGAGTAGGTGAGTGGGTGAGTGGGTGAGTAGGTGAGTGGGTGAGTAGGTGAGTAGGTGAGTAGGTGAGSGSGTGGAGTGGAGLGGQ
jgi:penicillin-binding protein 1A